MSNEVEIMPETQSVAVAQQITAAEVDMQVATAKRWPRSIDKCLKDAKTLATKTQEIAEGCFYTLPRGGKQIVGPSIRLAEILASSWGNLRCEARIVEEGARHVVAQATVWDMETNVLVRQEVRRRITGKDGHRYNDDMINTTANAATSIALRNAMLRVVPRSVVDDVFAAARSTAVGDIRTLDERRGRMLDAFGKLGIVADRVLAKLGRRGVPDIGLEDLELLIGLYGSIRDGEIQIDDAFPPEDGPPEDGPPKPAKPTRSRAEEAIEKIGGGAKKQIVIEDRTTSKMTGGPPADDHPGPGLTLEELDTGRDAAGVGQQLWDAWLLDAGVVPNDRRTHSAARLDRLDALISEWEQGARE